MSDLTKSGTTQWAQGVQDTATVLVDNQDIAEAENVNGVAAFCIALQSVLGLASGLKGNFSNLSSYLASIANASGIVPASSGGTGVTTVAAGDILIGGTNTWSRLAVGSSGSVLGVSGGLPAWTTSGQGVFTGPTSTGAGSAIVNEGNVAIVTTSNIAGTHSYTTFTLNSSVSIIPPAGTTHLVLFASSSITINGTINLSGSTGNGGPYSDGVGGSGTDQGGGGGVNTVTTGGAGGFVYRHGISLGQGTAQGGTGPHVGGNTSLVGLGWPAIGMGGSGGGAGGGLLGGSGGGSLTLVAPSITLGNGAVLNTSGAAGGSTGSNAGGGGGGGAGNIYIYCHSFTDNGAIYTQTGGAGGTFQSGSAGAGAAGIRFVFIY